LYRLQFIPEKHLGGRMIFLGTVPQSLKMLTVLWKEATYFVFPPPVAGYFPGAPEN